MPAVHTGGMGMGRRGRHGALRRHPQRHRQPPPRGWTSRRRHTRGGTRRICLRELHQPYRGLPRVGSHRRYKHPCRRLRRPRHALKDHAPRLSLRRLHRLSQQPRLQLCRHLLRLERRCLAADHRGLPRQGRPHRRTARRPVVAGRIHRNMRHRQQHLPRHPQPLSQRGQAGAARPLRQPRTQAALLLRLCQRQQQRHRHHPFHGRTHQLRHGTAA